MDKVYKIYKIQFPNNKVYIGQTYNINKRWKEHLQEAKCSNTKVYKAMRKYSITIENFSVIEDNILTQEDANFREIYYIALYDSVNNGYNCGPGGNNGWQPRGESHPKAVLTDEELLQLRIIRASKVYTFNQVFEFYKDRMSYSGFEKYWSYQSRPEVGSEYNNAELSTFYRTDKRELRGENHFLSKITKDQVIQARQDYWVNGVKLKDIYQDFKNIYSLSGFRKIVLGNTYIDIPMPEKSQFCKKKREPLSKEEIIDIRNLYLTKSIKEISLLKNLPVNIVKKIVLNISYKNY